MDYKFPDFFSFLECRRVLRERFDETLYRFTYKDIEACLCFRDQIIEFTCNPKISEQALGILERFGGELAS